MGDPLRQFKADWLERLNSGARTVVETSSRDGENGLYSGVADSFVSGLGYKPIGFNWELLDPSADPESPRSAIAEITSALAGNISNPSQDWLDVATARQCAIQLLEAFDRTALTVVSNRYDGLWNPISGAPVEWGFVLFDNANIALLLITE
ncbi:hypothetical protein [Erythrobacter sp. F6033]|uniref:hypothetical protein n=1 Tax=Erythrobacter sp. F6033 TaxID=2926401 RepID=UPI001FF4BC9C|nr:hypothetical protein [Erythrobacter sp. F6033]MCK0129543.1 hypothetical protein [Erythrobacter sp. F6033]